jgi:hypothetical protein
MTRHQPWSKPRPTPTVPLATPSNNIASRLSTCVSTGSKIESPKANFLPTSAAAKTTLRTVLFSKNHSPTHHRLCGIFVEALFFRLSLPHALPLSARSTVEHCLGKLSVCTEGVLIMETKLFVIVMDSEEHLRPPSFRVVYRRGSIICFPWRSDGGGFALDTYLLF